MEKNQYNEIWGKLAELDKVETEYVRSWLMNNYPIYMMADDVHTMMMTIEGVGVEYEDISKILINIKDRSKWEIEESSVLEFIKTKNAGDLTIDLKGTKLGEKLGDLFGKLEENENTGKPFILEDQNDIQDSKIMMNQEQLNDIKKRMEVLSIIEYRYFIHYFMIIKGITNPALLQISAEIFFARKEPDISTFIEAINGYVKFEEIGSLLKRIKDHSTWEADESIFGDAEETASDNNMDNDNKATVKCPECDSEFSVDNIHLTICKCPQCGHMFYLVVG